MIKSKTAVRLATLAGISFAAVSAHALTLDFATAGTGTLVGGTNFVQTESILFMLTNPNAPALTSYTASTPVPLPGGTGTALATDGGADSLSMQLQWGTNYSLNGNFLSIAGTWSYLGGTGAYGGFASGGGTFAVSVDASSGAFPFNTYTSVVGQLNTVPEPASMAVVGLGLIGLVARRRRS